MKLIPPERLVDKKHLSFWKNSFLPPPPRGGGGGGIQISGGYFVVWPTRFHCKQKCKYTFFKFTKLTTSPLVPPSSHLSLQYPYHPYPLLSFLHYPLPLLSFPIPIPSLPYHHPHSPLTHPTPPFPTYYLGWYILRYNLHINETFAYQWNVLVDRGMTWEKGLFIATHNRSVHARGGALLTN